MKEVTKEAPLSPTEIQEIDRVRKELKNFRLLLFKTGALANWSDLLCNVAEKLSKDPNKALMEMTLREYTTYLINQTESQGAETTSQYLEYVLSMHSNRYLDGTYTSLYDDLDRVAKQFGVAEEDKHFTLPNPYTYAALEHYRKIYSVYCAMLKLGYTETELQM